ncbi:6-phosphogluconolactonase [Alkalihalophilus pseudofirmus]|nr:6-phosphogluconolactonase [Alkalihalophilus pseudofirmus]
MEKIKGYIGTYTKGDSKGIYSFTLDLQVPQIQDVKVAAHIENPTYLTIDRTNKYLYSVAKKGETGGIAVYTIDDISGDLQLLDSQLEEGPNPCHVSVDSQNNYVVNANYHKGTVQLMGFNNNNEKILSTLSTVKHEGSGPNKDRQEKPHVHYSGFTPDEKFIVVIDLGIDKLITYEVNDEKLNEVNSLSLQPGSGPRHLEFHPNGQFAYLMTELSSQVITLAYDRENGSFTEVQHTLTIPENFTENNQGSAIHVSSDGKFVYVSNRGHNSIASFSVDESGHLTLIDFTPTEGAWPRDFVLDPTEKFLVVSNQESCNLTLFARNTTIGTLARIQSDIAVPDAVCVKFLNT